MISTSSLGDRSYLASDGGVAVVVDPQRDIDRVLMLAGHLGVRITHVAETHVHNDYLSGGLHLARVAGARYLVAAADRVAFERTPVADGDLVPVSDRMRLRSVATPGHTFHHLSYVLEAPHYGSGWEPVGVFTGGSLLFSATGRTDLLGRQHTDELAYAQHASARRLADLLPDGTRVWPTHGFGGFCAAGHAEVSASTIGREKTANPVLRLAADEFVTRMLAGLDAYPAYYTHVGPTNSAGPAPVDLTPVEPADAGVLRERLTAGHWVVDLRHRTAYASAHIAGTVSLGLDGPMSTWLGWLIDWGTPVTLLGETSQQVAEAQRELARIGIDRPAGAATGQPDAWACDPNQLRHLARADFAALAASRTGPGDSPARRHGTCPGDSPARRHGTGPGDLPARRGTGPGDSSARRHGGPPAALPAADVVLDVRMGDEWRASHIDGATHVPLYELPRRLAAVPPGAVWVHCSSGYRATAGASLLANAGRQVVVVDDAYDRAGAAGLPIVAT